MNSPLTRLIPACVLISGLLLSACQPGDVPVVSAAEEDYAGRSVRAANCDYGGAFRSIEALDRYTVKITLCESDPAFATKIAFPVFAITDDEALQNAAGASGAIDSYPNGSGPYLVKEWISGDHLTLEANPNYWGAPVRTKTLEFRWNSEAVRRQADLQFGAVDGIDRPSGRDTAALLADQNLKLYSRSSLNTFFIGMNNTIPPFGSEKVRQGISMALDRQAIMDSQFQSSALLADQFLPASMQPGFTPGYRWYDFNQKEAVELLEEANFDFTQVIPLYYSAGEQDYLTLPDLAAATIRSQLRQVGIAVQPTPMPQAEFEAAVRAGKLGLFLYGWVATYPDPTDFYTTFFGAESKALGKPYSDIQFMMREAANAAEQRDRQSRYNRLNELVRLHAPAIPVAHISTTVMFNAGVQNVLVGPMNENFEQLSTANDRLVFMQAHEPAHLWPADETDGDALRVSRLVYDTLLQYEWGGAGLRPNLAEYWESNSSFTEWTFTLRYGVEFSSGAELEANDVVASLAAMWDASDPAHRGSSGQFAYFRQFFGNFLNAPAQ